jgi:hypothetical protein
MSGHDLDACRRQAAATLASRPASAPSLARVSKRACLGNRCQSHAHAGIQYMGSRNFIRAPVIDVALEKSAVLIAELCRSKRR